MILGKKFGNVKVLLDSVFVSSWSLKYTASPEVYFDKKKTILIVIHFHLGMGKIKEANDVHIFVD